MLKNIHKITQNEFQSLMKSGKYTQNPLFTLISGVQISKNQEKLVLRCAVVVSKQVSKKAVERNKMRRRIYSIMQKNQNTLKNNSFYIFLAKKPLLTAPFSEVEQNVSGVLGN